MTDPTSPAMYDPTDIIGDLNKLYGMPLTSDVANRLRGALMPHDPDPIDDNGVILKVPMPSNALAALAESTDRTDLGDATNGNSGRLIRAARTVLGLPDTDERGMRL